MISITALSLAMVVSAAVVWVASAIVWMVLPWHKTDFKAVADEEGARAALKGLPPGQYDIPHCTSPAEMKQPEMAKRFNEGPSGFITIRPNGIPGMGGAMLASFVFYLVVGVVVAYIASRSLPAGTAYLKVFQVTGAAAWVAHSFGVTTDAIWFGKPWSSVGKTLLDGLIYALLTGGVFGWLWPPA